MDAEKKAVIKEIRCLVVTSTNGVYLKRLWREYKETTGEYIPFRKFGFDSTEQFLRSTNEFILRSCDGDFVLMARPTAESAHISKLIQSQNKKKKRSDPPRSNRPMIRRPQYGYQSSKPAYQTNSSYSTKSGVNNSSYSYQSSAPKPFVPFANTTNYNNQNYSNSYGQPAPVSSAPPAKVQTHQPVQEIPIERKSTNPFLNDGRHHISITKPTDASTSQSYQPAATNQRENGINERCKRWAEAFGIPSKCDEFCYDQSDNMHSTVQREQARRLAEENQKRNMAKARETTDSAQMFTTPIPDILSRSRKNSQKELLKKTMLAEQVSKLCLDTKPKENIQSRLQLPKKSPDSIDLPPQCRIEPEPEPEQPSIETFDFTELDACNSAVEAITLYCSKKKLPEPSFKFVQMRSKKFICLVQVNNVRYACYPNEYKTRDEAQKATAEIALLEIKELDDGEKYPVCKDSPHDIAQQINACIGENGIFLDSLQTVFQSTYQQRLPKEWRLFIQGNADLFELEMNDFGKVIVYPKRPKLVDAQPSKFKLRPTQIDQTKPIQLPWWKKNWNIFVTTIRSIDDVRGFLHGEDDKDNLADMIERYELKLMAGERKEVVASNIRIGGIYYTTYFESDRTRIMRIQIMDVDDSRRKAQCYFIDLGEEELVSFDRVYVLDPSMLEIPAQAIRFSLADLDVFDDDELIECEAINVLFNNHVIAEIKSTEDEYLCGGNNPKLKAIFHLKYNDSNRKINLNLKIAMAVSKYFDPIELEDDRLINAIVTYVNDSGIIHCHLCDVNAIEYVCQLIKRLTANGIDRKYRVENLSCEDIYLVYSTYDEMWYRGMLVSLEPSDDLPFKFIDYGMVGSINTKNVYQLKELSGILNAFPPQAVNVRLYNERTKSTEFIKCLKRHLQKGDVVTMDVIDRQTNQIPLVKIWKRIDGSGIIDIFKICDIEAVEDDNWSVSSGGQLQASTLQRMRRNYSSNA